MTEKNEQPATRKPTDAEKASLLKGDTGRTTKDGHQRSDMKPSDYEKH